jgi:tetratricopeptide (TPR) repeat protein
VVWVADDFAAWLVGVLADAGRRRLTDLLLGSEFERALGQAATAAVEATADRLSLGNAERAAHLARVINEVFRVTAPDSVMTGTTVLEAVQAGVTAQVAVLEDPSLTAEPGLSSAAAEGIGDGVMAPLLTRRLLAEVVRRAAQGGPLAALAAQLNADLTRMQTQLQHQQMTGILAQLGEEILAAIASLGPARLQGQPDNAEIVDVRSILPADVTAFTGRGAELTQITAAVTAAAGTGGVVAIHAIDGMPGVGKTALAVRVAHLLKDRFLDRQLVVDLRGHTPGRVPARPEAALAGLLMAVGIDARSQPEDLAGRIGLWRDWMAGQRALLILDNAASSEQVAPLLPGSAGCLVLVTSRRHLGDLPGAVVPVLLDALSPGQAREMFLRLAPRAAAGPADAVAELAELAGFLPLAISLLARVYARHSAWSLRDLVGETRQSILSLTAEKDSVAAAFDVSYQCLQPRQQQFFRLIGLHPGSTVDVSAAAALAEVSSEEAAAHLDALHGEGLLTEPGYRRYGMHDLIRRYARDLAAREPGQVQLAAVTRLARACYGSVNYAFNRLNEGNVMVDADFLASWLAAEPPGVQAVDGPDPDNKRPPGEWFAAEMANLIAVTGAAQAAGLEITSSLACSLFYFLEVGGHFEEWRRVEQIGKDAAGTPRDRARSLRNRGRLALVRALEEQERLHDDADPRPSPAGACAEAIPLLEASRDLYVECQDRRGEATALRELADAYRLESTPGNRESISRAIVAYGTARAIYEDLGSGNGIASLTLALGITHAMGKEAVDHAEAELCYSKSLAWASAIGRDGQPRHRRLKVYALRRLGDLYRDQKDLAKAIEFYERCIKASDDAGDLTGKARALSYCGRVHAQLGQADTARERLTEAHEIFTRRPLGARDPEARVVQAWITQLDDVLRPDNRGHD